MPQTIPIKQFRIKIEEFLEDIADKDEALEIEHKGKTFIISVKPKPDKLSKLKPHPNCINGDPEDIVHIDWSGEWKDGLS